MQARCCNEYEQMRTFHRMDSQVEYILWEPTKKFNRKLETLETNTITPANIDFRPTCDEHHNNVAGIGKAEFEV